MSERLDESNGHPAETARDVQAQIDDLAAQGALMRTDIDGLVRRADLSQNRADVADARADVADARADASDARADAMDSRSDAMDVRVDAMEARAAVDREMIAELQAEGVVKDEHTAQLERALESARVIGAAIGILMEGRQVSQDEAFSLLRTASQRANRPIREIASAIVEGANALR